MQKQRVDFVDVPTWVCVRAERKPITVRVSYASESLGTGVVFTDYAYPAGAFAASIGRIQHHVFDALHTSINMWRHVFGVRLMLPAGSRPQSDASPPYGLDELPRGLELPIALGVAALVGASTKPRIDVPLYGELDAGSSALKLVESRLARGDVNPFGAATHRH